MILTHIAIKQLQIVTGIAIVNADDDDLIEKNTTEQETPLNNNNINSIRTGTQDDLVTNGIDSANKPIRLFQSSEKSQPIEPPNQQLNMKTRKPRKCTICGGLNHDKRNCNQHNNQGKYSYADFCYAFINESIYRSLQLTITIFKCYRQ